jgi:hypothetical protein
MDATTTLDPGPTPRVRRHRWRILAGTAALSAAAVGVALVATPASADDPHRDTVIVECSSGIVTQGDIQTSALSVARVPADALANVPGGCVTR